MKTKFGGRRRQLQVNTDQLGTMVPLKNSHIKGFEKFSDLVQLSMVKLQADDRDSELEAGIFHSLLVKKPNDKQVDG